MAARDEPRGRLLAVQATLADVGTPLHAVDFVVVDLETTGGAPAGAGITEIGAVRLRAGEVTGEFQTLVDPGQPIPPFIAALTGITDRLVAGAPTVPSAVASFLEFSRGAVLVAHNAPYDIGFLRGACARHDLIWPKPTVLDTARISRAALLRDEVPNHRLATLAAHVGAGTQPTHRALDDARATVDVLHYLIGRVGDLGVHTVEELRDFSARVTREQRRKRTLADHLPAVPGVYIFRDHDGRPLYVGTSRNIRRRVLTYFTGSEKRTRMAEMVGVATRVDAIPCATALEAEIRESRLIAEEKPPYNRRSRHPERSCWVRFTAEPFPRLSVSSRSPSAGDCVLGPFPSRQQAESAAMTLTTVFGLRSCTKRLARTRRSPACAAAELGQCGAPCDGSQSPDEYSTLVSAAKSALTEDFSPVTEALTQRMRQLAERGDYDGARIWRDRLDTVATGARTAEDFAALARTAELIAAAPDNEGGWLIHVIRHGRLAGAGHCRRGDDPAAAVEAVRATAEVVAAPAGPTPAAHPDEARALLRWLAGPAVRLVRLDGHWSRRRLGAGPTAHRLHAVRRSVADALPAPLILAGSERRTARTPLRPDPRRVSRIALTG